MNLFVKKLFPDAELPFRANPTDSGLDVFVHHFEQYVPQADRLPMDLDYVRLDPGQRAFIATGLSVAVAPGFEVQVRPRSGNALKRGLTVLNTPGTIDSSYRGPVNIIIINLSNEPQVIKKGEKIAQLVVAPVCLVPVVEVENLDQTDRGEGGFGSTGV